MCFKQRIKVHKRKSQKLIERKSDLAFNMKKTENESQGFIKTENFLLETEMNRNMFNLSEFHSIFF